MHCINLRFLAKVNCCRIETKVSHHAASFAKFVFINGKKGQIKKKKWAFLTLDFNAVLRAVAMFVLLINAMFPAHYQDWASCALQRAAGGLEKRLPVGGLLGIRGFVSRTPLARLFNRTLLLANPMIRCWMTSPQSCDRN